MKLQSFHIHVLVGVQFHAKEIPEGMNTLHVFLLSSLS